MDSEMEEPLEYTVKVTINSKIILGVLCVFSIGLCIGGVLVYLFAEDLLPVLLSLIIGATLSVMSSYFLLRSTDIIQTQTLRIENKREDEYTSMMKINE